MLGGGRPAPVPALGGSATVPAMGEASSPGALEFRAARDVDVDAVTELVAHAYRGERSWRGWTTEADLLDGQRTDADAVRALLRSPDHEVLCAFRDGTLVGCCDVSRHAAGGHLAMFAVAPEEQGTGVGTALLSLAERTASGWGCRTMRMLVISLRSELVALYERRGYEATGATEPFPYGDERFGLPLRDDLEFVELRRTIA